MAGTAVRRVRKAQLGVRFAIAGLVAGMCIAWVAARRAPASSRQNSVCDAVFQSHDYTRAVSVCVVGYAGTHDPEQLARAADAAIQVQDLRFAWLLASWLQYTLQLGNAHQILSYVALRSGDRAAAWQHARLAFLVHQLAGNEHGLAGDAALLSEIALRQGDFTAAIAAGDEAVRLAERSHDRGAEARVKVIRAVALRRVGDVDRAIADLRDAVESTTDACSSALNQFALALAYEENPDRLGDARRALDEAAKYNQRCPSADLTDSLPFHQAWVRRISDPAGARARLDALLPSDRNDAEAWLLSGYLYGNAGALAKARRDLARAEALDPPDADWPWVIVCARAELAERRGGVFGPMLAEFHYRRAISMVTALRATAGGSSAYLVTSHRGPYDGLIALLAEQGRWREVLAVVLELDASDMLRATAHAFGHHDGAAIDIAAPTPAAAAPVRPPVDAVLAAWRSRDLVIVIAPSPREIASGRERAYRLRITGGEVAGEDVGASGEALRLADALYHAPGDRNAGRALGGMLIPAGPERGTLHVRAVGALGRAPLAALRDSDGTLTVARRSLVRVLGLVATSPESRGGGRAVVIADPTGELQTAAREGAVVARALEPGVRLAGAASPTAADRALLWTARDADLLHVAGHVRAVGRWRALVLADGLVEPAEMMWRGLAPRLAVLASCGSAAAMDEEGWGSIAAALLGAGTAVVIATDRSVDDAAALSVMLGFYAQPDWRSEPAAALARVQVALDARPDTDDLARQTWAAFSVLRRPPVVAAPP